MVKTLHLRFMSFDISESIFSKVISQKLVSDKLSKLQGTILKNMTMLNI